MNALLLLASALHAAPTSVPVRLGTYTVEVPVAAGEPTDLLRPPDALVPSPEAEAVTWLSRCLEGGRVRYGHFLGTERLRFERDPSTLLATRAPTDDPSLDGLVLLIWDRNANGRLSRRELVRGTEDLRAYVLARAAITLPPGPTSQVLDPPVDPSALVRAWQTAPPRPPPTCPACSDDPHQDKLAALLEWTLDYGVERDHHRAAVFETATGPVIVEVDVLPGPDSTLRLYGPDGRSWWDGGREGAVLDGELDLVTADAPFSGAAWSTLSRRWEQPSPGSAPQWTFELLVDAAHSAMPARRQVGRTISLAPDVAHGPDPGAELDPMNDLWRFLGHGVTDFHIEESPGSI